MALKEDGFGLDESGRYILKDPDAILTYLLDWDAPGDSWLGDDTISTAAFTVPAGLTKVSEGNTSTTARVRLSGGVAGEVYTVRCHVTTTAGDQDDRSFRVIMRER